MPKKRVHEIAKEQGLTSKEVLQALKDAGVYVKAASSTVEERDIRRAFPNGSKVAADKQKAAEAAKAAEEEAKKAAEAEAAAKKAEEEARKAAEEEAKKAAEEKAAKVAEETAAKAAEEEAKKAAEAEAAKKAAEEEAEKAKAAEAEAKKTAEEQDAKEAEAEAAKAAEADAEKPARARKSRDGDSDSDGAGAPDKPARGTGPRILDPGTTPRGQQQQRDGGGQRADVRPRRPLEVQRAEQLAARDQRQQREGPWQRVLARRPALDEQRQARAAEAQLVGLEGVHDSWMQPGRADGSVALPA
jgi:Translation initiation factor IF-2, N-terminal region